jgi:hypothetical protein
MQELLQTEDMGELASVKAVLEGAGIAYFVFEESIGSQYGYAVPWRIMVLENDFDAALDILEDAGFFDDENE